MAGARRDWDQTVRIAPDTATAALAARNIMLLGALPEGALRLVEPDRAATAPAPAPAPAPAQAPAQAPTQATGPAPGAAAPLPLPPPPPPRR
jgi:hypothetical protein